MKQYTYISRFVEIGDSTIEGHRFIGTINNWDSIILFTG